MAQCSLVFTRVVATSVRSAAECDAAFVEALAHGCAGDIHAFGNPVRRPPLVVQPDGVVDLLDGQAAPAHGDAVAMQDGTDGAAFDAELVA